MVGLAILLLGVLITVTHNTPGDLVAGIVMAVLGGALWLGPNVTRIR